MSKSLQDQLMAAGLADAKKSKAIAKEKRKAKKQQPKGQQALNENRQLAEQALRDKAERDRAMNQTLQQQAEQKAIAAQVKQLIELNTLPQDGEQAYNFVADDNKIKKLLVSNTLLEQLSRGQVAIVKHQDRFVLIPSVVADKIRERDQSTFIYIADKTADVIDEDDPYADYQIPDDLMW